VRPACRAPPARRVDPGTAAERREGQRDRGFGEAVDRHHRFPPEPLGREALDEALNGQGVDGLGTVIDSAQGREVEAVELGIANPPDAEIKGEIGGGGERALVAVNGLEPAHRAADEGQGRHQDERHTVIERAEPGADQPHVVVERQPAHRDVAWTNVDRGTDRPDIGQ
jgi:hypothetical protein